MSPRFQFSRRSYAGHLRRVQNVHRQLLTERYQVGFRAPLFLLSRWSVPARSPPLSTAVSSPPTTDHHFIRPRYNSRGLQEQRSILPGIWGDQCLRCRPCLGEATPAAFLHLTPTRALHPSCLLLPSCSPFNVSDRHVFAVTAMSLPQMSSIWSAFLHLPDDIMWRMNQKRPFNFDVIVPDQM